MFISVFLRNDALLLRSLADLRVRDAALRQSGRDGGSVYDHVDPNDIRDFWTVGLVYKGMRRMVSPIHMIKTASTIKTSIDLKIS